MFKLCTTGIYTVFQKSEATKLLAITFSILTDFQNYFIAEKRINITTKPHNIFHHTLTMFSHYLGKFNSSNLLQFITKKIKKCLVFDKNKTFVLSHG